MPDDAPPAAPASPGAFEPRALRVPVADRVLHEACLERVLAAHPAWPWPLIEEEARRRAEAALAAGQR